MAGRSGHRPTKQKQQETNKQATMKNLSSYPVLAYDMKGFAPRARAEVLLKETK